jgi:hypothetical protein
MYIEGWVRAHCTPSSALAKKLKLFTVECTQLTVFGRGPDMAKDSWRMENEARGMEYGINHLTAHRAGD